ncbi:hypothetical protein ACFL96_04565 [Thermoproteota archaeon]
MRKTFVGPQGSGKSTIAINTLWALDKILRHVNSNMGDGAKLRALLADLTPEGTTSDYNVTDRSMVRYPLKTKDRVAEYVELVRNPHATPKYIRKQSSNYDLAFIDTSSAKPDHVDEVMKVSDSIILVTTSDDDVNLLLGFLKRAQKANPRVRLDQIVLNRFTDFVDYGRRREQFEKTSLRKILEMKGFDIEKYVSTLPSSQRLNRYCEKKVPAFPDDRADDPQMYDLFGEFTQNLIESRRLPLVKDLVASIEKRL